MQNTRLNGLFDTASNNLGEWLRNPWRRLSVLIISLLFGNFLGTAVATIAGQRAELDVIVAGILVLLTELVSFITYRRNPPIQRSLLLQFANALKIGFSYSLFVEAFKLGS